MSGYHVGGEYCTRIAKIERIGRGLGNRKMRVALVNGDVYVIEQPDRGYFYIDGPHLTGCRCDGWVDGLQLLNNL